MTSIRSATSLAAAAALIALGSASIPTTVHATDAATVHCFGVNACKGQSDCKSGNHQCKGMNSCKGQGFKDLTTQACKARGGSLTAPK